MIPTPIKYPYKNTKKLGAPKPVNPIRIPNETCRDASGYASSTAESSIVSTTTYITVNTPIIVLLNDNIIKFLTMHYFHINRKKQIEDTLTQKISRIHM